jgi:hypothetical protein
VAHQGPLERLDHAAGGLLVDPAVVLEHGTGGKAAFRRLSGAGIRRRGEVRSPGRPSPSALPARLDP